MKHLRRRVIMRQYDYVKHHGSFVPSYYSASNFVPITLKELEQEYLFKILDGTLDAGQFKKINFEYPKNYLQAMGDYLYKRDYVNWFSEYDEDGYMWIQARANTPSSILGWAIFELDYE